MKSILERVDSKYLQWFVGLTDAEGNFSTHKEMNSQVFQLGLSQRDTIIIEELREKLNFGYIYKRNKDNMIYFIVSDKQNLYNNIIPIFETYPLLTRKLYQYQAWKKILIKRFFKEKFVKKKENFKLTANDNLTKEEIIKLPYFDNWLIGFINGDGTNQRLGEGWKNFCF